MKRTKAAVVDISLQLSIYAQTLGMASIFKLPSQCKNMLTRTFSQANLGKMAIMAASSLGSALPQPSTPCHHHE
jgi:hypothetical protein